MSLPRFPTAATEKAAERLWALDGIRGVAALSIVVYHDSGTFSSNPLFFQWGWINVDLFFLLSGIVITHVYETQVESGRTSFTQFLSHRLARLWPMHFFALLSVLAIEGAHEIWGGPHLGDWSAPLYTFLLNVVFLQNIGLYTSAAYGHTWDGNAWSLSPEIFVNLVWFYLVVRKRLSSKLLVSLVLALAVLQYNWGGDLSGLILSSNLVRCSISYAMGCVLYRHFIANPHLPRPSVATSNVAGLTILALLVFIILNLTLWQRPFTNHWDWIFVLFVFPSFTYFALQPETVLNRILSSRLFVFLGTISYSIYLMHPQVGFLLTFAEDLLSEHGVPAPYKGIVLLLGTIGVATLTYRLIETPSRKALRNGLDPFLRRIFFDRY